MAGTNYEDAFKRAFEMADTSYASNYDSGCQTVYVFLTGIYVFSTRLFVAVSLGLSILMHVPCIVWTRMWVWEHLRWPADRWFQVVCPGAHSAARLAEQGAYLTHVSL